MFFRIGPHLFRVLLIVPALVSVGGLGVAPARGQSTKITEFPAGLIESTYCEDVVFAPTGRSLVLVKPEGVLRLCDLATGRTEPLPNPYGGKQWDTKVAYSVHGRFLAVGYGAYGIVIWDLDMKKEMLRIPLRRAAVHDMVFIDGGRNLFALLVTRQGNLLAAGWEVPSGAPRSTLDFGKFHHPEVLSPDGRHAVLKYALGDHAVFDLSNRKQIFDLKRGGGWVFSRDGSTIVSCEEDRLSVRELPSGKELRHFLASPIFGRAVSPEPSLSADGKLLAVQSYPEDHLAGVFSLETGKLLDQVECGPPLSLCNLVRLSPDGRTMATRTDGVNARDQPVKPILKIWKVPASR